MSQYRTRVKVCGLTRVEDVNQAVAAGADAIGLVFYPKSARCVGLEQARRLRDAVPAMVDVVALFVNASPDEVRQVIEHVQPDVLQFHGDETPDYCSQFGRRYMRAFRAGAPGLESSDQVLAACLEFDQAAAWLFDSYSAGYGGSGRSFDFSLLDAVRADGRSRPVVLAGGLNSLTVADAMTHVRPYAVDVSSGVEASPGIKVADKVAGFIAAVAQADQALRGQDQGR
ncbi:phosphoribosylanthranilate isomerase [Neopusillimonas aromaticivorans]|uniref:phosphoribosylanthranilate isomerase n=1 Tax=Neopusillimonas aromaticivorans TaxID=2979868 RepID=UPI00259253D3|nr:phosphoribosylanthranilate isomerase [Neopusillimonas aromaticivorans]WJJ93544.1 phosphoribosylanthranilate isomerase [Neopusillimonas aromaticivorans]